MKLPNPAWKNVFQALDMPLDCMHWLANADSLTKALEDASGTQCQVAVQQEGWDEPWEDECGALSTAQRSFGDVIEGRADHGRYRARGQRCPFPRNITETFGKTEIYHYWIREVVLSARQPAIFARTIFPQALVNNVPAIAQLGNQSLGRTLFADNRFQRGPIEVAEINFEHLLWQHIPERLRSAELWARRSVFSSDIGSLLVSEVFLSYVATL